MTRADVQKLRALLEKHMTTPKRWTGWGGQDNTRVLPWFDSTQEDREEMGCILRCFDDACAEFLYPNEVSADGNG